MDFYVLSLLLKILIKKKKRSFEFFVIVYKRCGNCIYSLMIIECNYWKWIRSFLILLYNLKYAKCLKKFVVCLFKIKHAKIKIAISSFFNWFMHYI